MVPNDTLATPQCSLHLLPSYSLSRTLDLSSLFFPHFRWLLLTKILLLPRILFHQSSPPWVIFLSRIPSPVTLISASRSLSGDLTHATSLSNLPGTMQWPNSVISGGWPKSNAEYNAWVKRLVACKSDLWKEWGIHDMITVSTKEVSNNVDLLFPLMSFWPKTLNAFIFLWLLRFLSLFRL